MVNELIKVNQETMTVSARDLHDTLEIGTRFNVWFPRMCEYGFTDGADYKRVSQICDTPGGKQEMADYSISIDMAKQICMIQRTEIGKQVRQYFIDLEKAWNTPEQIMARALKVADETIANLKVRNKELSGEVLTLTEKVEEMQPKATYYDTILQSKDTVLTTQIAQDYGMSARRLNRLLFDLGIQHKVGGQWILYSKYQGKGYVQSKTYAYAKSDGSDGVSMNTEWRQSGRLFLYEKLKENGVLPLIER